MNVVKIHMLRRMYDIGGKDEIYKEKTCTRVRMAIIKDRKKMNKAVGHIHCQHQHATAWRMESGDNGYIERDQDRPRTTWMEKVQRGHETGSWKS